MHDIMVVEFAKRLGWDGLGVFWLRYQNEGEPFRYFEARKRHSTILFNEAYFEPNYNFAACVYCRRFGAISGFLRIRIREDDDWNRIEADRVRTFLGADRFKSRDQVELYKSDYPHAYRLARDFLNAGKIGKPPIAFFHHDSDNRLVEEVYDFNSKEWRSPVEERG